jgi:hypothetical protein
MELPWQVEMMKPLASWEQGPRLLVIIIRARTGQDAHALLAEMLRMVPGLAENPVRIVKAED